MSAKSPGDGKVRQEVANAVGALEEALPVFLDAVAAKEGVEDAFEPVEAAAREVDNLTTKKNHKGQAVAHNNASIKSASDAAEVLDRTTKSFRDLADSGALANYPDIAKKIDRLDGEVYLTIKAASLEMHRANKTQQAKGVRA